MSLSNEIKLIRQKSIMTQTEFATKLNVSFATVNRWEQGKAKPNITAMKKLKAFCDKQGLPFDEIENAWLSDKKAEARE